MRRVLLHGGAMADWNQNCWSIGHYNYTVAFPTPRTLSFQRFKSEFQLLSEKNLIVQVADAVLLNTVSLNTTRARKDGYTLDVCQNSGQLRSSKPLLDEKKSNLGRQWSKFIVQDLFLKLSKCSVLINIYQSWKCFAKYVSKSTKLHDNIV